MLHTRSVAPAVRLGGTAAPDAPCTPLPQAFYDIDAVLRRAISVDFARALGEGGLERYIARDYSEGGEGVAGRLTCEEVEAEVDEVREVLVDHAREIYSMFDFYASLGSGSSATTIGFNAYKQFVADGDLTIDRSQHSDDSHFDQLFTAVNAAGAVAAAKAARQTGMRQQGGSRAFARSEMLHALIRIAIGRYIMDGAERDVSQAVVCLCDRLRERLVPQARQDADTFRRQFCYTEAVDEQLQRHKRSLRFLFETYADPPNIKSREAKLLRIDDWMLMLRHLCFFDEAFQQIEGTLCFAFSRLRVCDGRVVEPGAHMHGEARRDETGRDEMWRASAPPSCQLCAYPLTCHLR